MAPDISPTLFCDSTSTAPHRARIRSRHRGVRTINEWHFRRDHAPRLRLRALHRQRCAGSRRPPTPNPIPATVVPLSIGSAEALVVPGSDRRRSSSSAERSTPARSAASPLVPLASADSSEHRLAGLHTRGRAIARVGCDGRRHRRRRADRAGPLQVEVHVVLPGEADAAVHLQRRRQRRARTRRSTTPSRSTPRPTRPGRRRAMHHAAQYTAERMPSTSTSMSAQAMLDRLEAADRPAELHALLGVLDGRGRAARRDAEQLGRDVAIARRRRSAARHRPRRATSRASRRRSSQPTSRVRSIAGSRRRLPARTRRARRRARDGDGGRRRVRHDLSGSRAATHADRVARDQRLGPRRCPTAHRARRAVARSVRARHARRPPRQHRRFDKPRPRPPADSATAMPVQPCSTIARQNVASHPPPPSNEAARTCADALRPSSRSRAASRSAC